MRKKCLASATVVVHREMIVNCGEEKGIFLVNYTLMLVTIPLVKFEFCDQSKNLKNC